MTQAPECDDHPELVADWDAYTEANGVAVFERDMGYGRY